MLLGIQRPRLILRQFLRPRRHELIVDQDTVTAAIEGDADALRRALESCGPRLRSHFADRIARCYQAALGVDDVLQVTYIEAFLHIDRFRPDGPDSFFSWLRHIGENNLRDAIRALDADKRPDRRKQVSAAPNGDSYTSFLATISATGTTPTKNATREEAREILEAALADLPPPYAKAIRLCDLEERDIDDACVAFDPPKSRGAVHMMRMRARDCLKALLGDPDAFLTAGS